MTNIGAWEIGPNDEPFRLARDREFLEAHLETWIQRSPSLLASDVRWVSRQLVLPDRSRLDLLGLTRDGTWIIAELKAGAVGTGAVLQAVHYFLQLAALTNSELADRISSQGRSLDINHALRELALDPDGTARDYLLLVAGVGAGEPAETSVAILAQHGLDIPVRVVTFELCRSQTGNRILLREVDEDTQQSSGGGTSLWLLEDILATAGRFGVLDAFEAIRKELRERGFRESKKKHGLNFNLGSRSQCLWVRPAEGKLHMGYLEGNFPGLFGVEESQAVADMGQNWVDLPPDEAVQQVVTWAEQILAYQAAALAERAEQ